MRDYLVLSNHKGPSKEQQLDLLTKHVVGGNRKSVNVILATSNVMFDRAPFEGGYNERYIIWANKWGVLGQLFLAHLEIKVGTIMLDGKIMHSPTNLKLGLEKP